MSDLDLLLFGCVVTFIGAGGAYVYLRESLAGRDREIRSEVRSAEAVTHEVRDVA